MTIEIRDDEIYTNPMPSGSWVIGGRSQADAAPTAFGRVSIASYVQSTLAAVAMSGDAGDLTGTLPTSSLHVNLADIAGFGTSVQGALITYDGANWVQLEPGTAGQVLFTGGTGADAYWGTVAAGGVAFNTIAVSGQSNVEADQVGDTLTFAGAGAVVITTNAGSDLVTFSVDLTAYLTSAAAAATYLTSADLTGYLRSDTTAELTVGFTSAVEDDGTKSSGTFTPTYAAGNMHKVVNGGAHTLAPPSGNGTMIVKYTNNASAGTITTSGWTVVSGDAPDTTDGNDFLAYITTIDGSSHLTWVALQ